MNVSDRDTARDVCAKGKRANEGRGRCEQAEKSERERGGKGKKISSVAPYARASERAVVKRNETRRCILLGEREREKAGCHATEGPRGGGSDGRARASRVKGPGYIVRGGGGDEGGRKRETDAGRERREATAAAAVAAAAGAPLRVTLEGAHRRTVAQPPRATRPSGAQLFYARTPACLLHASYVFWEYFYRFSWISFGFLRGIKY